MGTIAELQAREEECEREWHWLIQTLNIVAAARCEEGETQAFRLMQQQAVKVGQRRIELMMERAHLECPGGCSSYAETNTRGALAHGGTRPC